ncbi:MAG: Spy/CpxP family protein refolding chaperone [Proteobacteria bacterium]|nr:Spy/CpxP family protein refolding chaperone [Pseudomonadota bacterium]
MRKTTKIALAVGAALSLGLAAAELTAHPSDGGYGMGPGAGMGYGMQGYGMHGYGMGPGAGMGYGMHGGGMGFGAGMGYGMHGGGMGFGAGPEATENRLADLKSQLGITAQQETAWQAFVNSAKQREKSRQSWFDKMHEARTAGSLPERLAQHDEVFKQHQAERQAATAALKDLYTALSPEQRTVADETFGGFGPRYGAGYGRGNGGGPGGRFR